MVDTVHRVGGQARISVRPGGLDEFAGKVQGHLDKSLYDQVAAAQRAYEQGVAFGARLGVCAEVSAARERYQACLSKAHDTLHTVLTDAEAMVWAAQVAARRYKDADALAAVSVDDINTLLDQARTAVRQSHDRKFQEIQGRLR
jgi:hypothetical protein